MTLPEMDDDTDSTRLSAGSSEKDVSESLCDETELEKKLAIETACAQLDIPGLKALAESEGGFMTDDLRRRACTYLWPPHPQSLAVNVSAHCLCLALSTDS